MNSLELSVNGLNFYASHTVLSLSATTEDEENQLRRQLRGLG